MSLSTGKRPLLSLPERGATRWSPELFCQQLKRKNPYDAKRRIIPALNQIVHISAHLATLSGDTPPSCRPLFGVNGDGQPSVFNGFVWSYRGDGTHHQVQHFVEGADIYGGRPLHIFNGVVYMHSHQGETLECIYRLGQCVRVQSRSQRHV